MPFHNHEEEEEGGGGGGEKGGRLEIRVSNFQPSFETSAKFSFLIFLNPSPPNSLGMQRESKPSKRAHCIQLIVDAQRKQKGAHSIREESCCY
jgi:hypothetical protein